MNQRTLMIRKLHDCLRANKVTYARVAAAIGKSEATVKRLFKEENMDLERLETICGMMDMTISDLARMADDLPQPVYELTLEQEGQLVSNHKLLLLAFLLINEYTVDEIAGSYALKPKEIEQGLYALHRIGLIDLIQPGNRVKVLASRNFRWQRHGPINQLVWRRLLPEFIKTTFRKDTEYAKFVPVMASHQTFKTMTEEFERLSRMLHELARQDTREFGPDELFGHSAVMAMRQWVFSDFVRFKKHRSI